MKKTILSMVICSIALSANAQTYLVAGANLSNITKNTSGQTEDNNALFSFNAGLLYRFDLSNFVDVETGLLLTGKGSKAETYFNGGNDYVKSTFNPLYVELPLNAVVKVGTAKGTGIFVHAGPYAAMGVAGKAKTNSKLGILTSSSEKSIEFNNDDPFTSQQEDAGYNKLKRFDFGLNIGAGIQMKKTMLRLNYGYGLAKINSTESNNSADEKNKYRTLSLSVAFGL